METKLGLSGSANTHNREEREVKQQHRKIAAIISNEMYSWMEVRSVFTITIMMMEISSREQKPTQHCRSFKMKISFLDLVDIVAAAAVPHKSINFHLNLLLLLLNYKDDDCLALTHSFTIASHHIISLASNFH